MDQQQFDAYAEQRVHRRLPAEPGTTVHIQSGEYAIVGTLENRHDTGLCARIPDNAKFDLSHRSEISVTYSMPFGLVSRRAQVCWVKAGDNGLLKLGTAFLENAESAQTDYQRLWKRFNEADKLETAAQIWLAMQCAMLSGVIRGLLVIGKPDSGIYAPTSFWPEGQRGSLGLSEAAELGLHEKRGILRDKGVIDPDTLEPVCEIAYPLLWDSRLYGVVAVEMVTRSEIALRAAMRQLQWGSAWLELFMRREEGKKFSPENQQLATVLELVALGLEQESFQGAATAVATELATVLKCERVSIGFSKDRYMQVRAVSHSADFAQKSNLITSLGLAMDEAMEQMATLAYPPLNPDVPSTLRCHEKLAREHGGGAICTIPFCNNDNVYGAITLERAPKQLFDSQTISLAETISSLIGPILESKRQEDLWLPHKAWLALKQQYRHLVGPAHGGLKLGAALFVLAVLFCVFATGEYRVAADTHLEGEIQRVIATPFDGYISEAYVRAGDVVAEGAALAKLDDRDLLLEKAKFESQREQYLKEYRDALAQTDRSRVGVSQAQLQQVEAQLALNASQLARLDLRAPFAGIIVSGDLSQKLGSPSQRGDVLFEIAPLDTYRVVLNVDERDIAYVRTRQTGELVLTGHAEQRMPFTVSKVTPVSEVKEGRNYFRVEAMLERPLDYLRPGMKGVGKIQAGEYRLVWIWSKNLLDWLRLTFWTWWPDGL